MTDAASFAIRGDAQALQKAFVEKLTPVVAQCCSKRLTAQEIAQCVQEAAAFSGWGRFVLGNNYWMLPGRGDGGSFLIVRVQRDFSSPSAVKPIIEKYAKFNSLPAALDAWCRRRGK